MKRPSLKRTSTLRRTELNKRGKKTRVWDRIRRALKVEFEKRNIVTCELNLPGCWKSNALSMAHSKKRRFITSDELMREVIISCVPCHSQIEVLPHAEMERIVKDVIERRVA